MTIELLHVDGINNVLVGLDRHVFEAAGIDPATYAELVKRQGANTFTVKIGAAGARYVGDTLELGEEPREWPPDRDQLFVRLRICRLSEFMKAFPSLAGQARKLRRICRFRTCNW